MVFAHPNVKWKTALYANELLLKLNESFGFRSQCSQGILAQLGVKLIAISTDRLEHLNTKMAKNLGLLNPALSGSTISLDRRSNSSLNVIDNAMYVDADSGNPYNTLQRNDNHQVSPRPKRTQNAVYDDIYNPRVVGQNQSRTSQTPKKPGRARQGKNGRIFRVVLMFLIVLVAIIALLLVLLLMMGKVGPKCRCRTSNSGEKVLFARYFYQILVHVSWERAGNVYRGKGNVYLNANLNSADILTVKHFAFK